MSRVSATQMRLCLGAQRDAISASRTYSLTHAQMIERVGKARLAYGWNRMTQRQQEYLRGAYDEAQHQMYFNDLVFGCYIDGKFYSAHSSRDDYYEKQGMSARIYAEHSGNITGHYWAHSLKLFFSSHVKES